MFHIRLFYISLLCFLFSPLLRAQVSFQTREFRLTIDQKGRLSEMTTIATNKNYLAENQPASLLSVQRNGKLEAPLSLQWMKNSNELVLTYPGNHAARIKADQKADFIKFELIQLTDASNADLVLWGPFPTTIGDTIGEVVGVVRNKEFAIGIQALNVKTLGGYPSAESDIQPSYDVFQGGNKVDVAKDDLDKQLFRGDVAKATDFGSVLQAYCRNRNKDRIIENWNNPKYLTPAFQDGGVLGSKLAIFGVPVKEVLSTISKIELQEDLPHPMLDGVWGKQSQKATESYLIMNFGVDNVGEGLAITQQAGLQYLYHGDPFETWGHFKLKSKEFPDNWKSMKKCVDVAKSKNIRLGVHTLSNFITTNDPYVTPVPDRRLARVGYSNLTDDIDAANREIGITDPAFFNQFENNTLRAVVVGNEIIRYEKISATAPWKLLNCQRGAYNTQASSHQKNDSIGKLMDHAYQVFLGDHSLDQEIAKTIAKLFNETGLMQISFDGLEGCWSEGMGDYGKQLFTKTWFDNLKPELKGKVINDASNPGHYFWHIYTRMNWGEPWYAGFRESHVQLRLKNQQFFRRNLMPSMLGWFNMKSETTLEDIEWMLARGAGFNAGFALVAGIDAIKKNGRSDEILATINLWETARHLGVFSENQKSRMQDIKNEFHLESLGPDSYRLTPIYNAYFTHQQTVKQPGEPVFSTFQFNNPGAKQPVAFIITTILKNDNDPDVTYDNLSISINQQNALVLPVSLKRNEILYCDGDTVKLYNKQWQLLQTIFLSTSIPVLSNGNNTILFDGKYSGENGADIKIEIRAKGEGELLKKKVSP